MRYNVSIMTDLQEDSHSTGVNLRDVLETDLDIFFEQQQDPQANYMAAFTAENPADKNAFTIKWAKILGDKTFVKRTILYDGKVAGHIIKFEQFGEPEISYWIGKEFWGQGVATRALALFLDVVAQRPLFARAAKDNIASICVLQKNGFTIIGEGKGYANARSEEIEEYILKLN
jgi:RimJ/RimL family protein N-acetyltransferase